MNIGNIIADIRKSKNIKQGVLAKKAGITQEYLSKIEKNRRIPQMELLQQIADILEFPLKSMFLLSLEKEDLKTNKQARYEEIFPFIESLTKTLFIWIDD